MPRNRLSFVLLSVSLILIALVFLFFRNSYWDGSSRIRLVAGNASGSVTFLLVDPRKSVIQLYTIPNDEIEAAYGLGKWKTSSLWKLGELEKKGGGTMLANSLVHGFGLPVEGYFKGIATENAFSLAKTLMTSFETSLSPVDRVKLTWFALRSKIETRGELTPEKIIVTGEELQKITDGIVTLIAATDAKDAQLKALSVVVSNLGGKVLDIASKDEEGECQVVGKSEYSIKLARVLGCSHFKSEQDGVELHVGKHFLDEF